MNSLSKKVCLLGLTIAATLLATVSQAYVTPVTLTDQNSVAKVDVDSNAGMYQWNINGIPQLAQQWFWYRIDPQAYVQPINSISSATYNQLAGPNTLFTKYENSQLRVQINYTLTGGTSSDSDILESISVKNNTAAAFTLHFFQYSDFDLDGSASGDTVSIDGDSSSGFWHAVQTKQLNQLSETVTSPNATRCEAAVAGQILTEFGTANYNLNNNQGPVGPDDVTWGLQWNFTVGAGATVDIFKDKRLDVAPVPEPAALGFVALGLAAFVLRRRARA